MNKSGNAKCIGIQHFHNYLGGGGNQSTALNSFLYSIINVKISHIKKILEFNLISTLKLHCGITASRIVSRIN